MQLPFSQHLLVVLALCQSSITLLQERGLEQLKSLLPEIRTGKNKLSPEVLHELLYVFRSTDGFTNKQKQVLVQSLLSAYPEADLNSVISPLIHTQEFNDAKVESVIDDMELVNRMKNALRPVHLVTDIGYSALSTTAKLKEILSQFSALSERDIAYWIVCSQDI
jgi:hypothetical protein